MNLRDVHLWTHATMIVSSFVLFSVVAALLHVRGTVNRVRCMSPTMPGENQYAK